MPRRTRMTPSKIAQEFGVSQQYVRNVIRELFGTLPRGKTRWRLNSQRQEQIRERLQAGRRSSRGRPPSQKSPTSNLDSIVEKIRTHLSAKHQAREAGLPASRDAIRHCANSIRATHRGEFDEARRLIERARALIAEAGSALKDHPDVYHAGFVHSAQKEHAEAAITLALASGAPLPDPDDLGVGYPAYLNGMGEAVGEMRRHLLDTLRKGDVGRCEEVLDYMDAMYTSLTTIDFPDGITAGLRRTTDMVRGVLERTRGDLTVARRQSALESQMRRLQKALEDKAG